MSNIELAIATFVTIATFVLFFGLLTVAVFALIDLYDWIYAVIEAAWKREHGK